MVEKEISDFIKQKLEEKYGEDEIVYSLRIVGVKEIEAKKAIKQVKNNILNEIGIPLPKNKPVVPGFLNVPKKNKPEKAILIVMSFFLFSVIGVVFFYFNKQKPPVEIPSTTIASTSWLKGYNYRKAIAIKSEESLSDYQVLVDVNYDSGMQSDFKDIRFTDFNTSASFDYWIETKTDNSLAKVWVKIPSLIVGDNTIYMYYGNSSVKSVSYGVGTFDFFEDFDPDKNTWTEKDKSWSYSLGYQGNAKRGIQSDTSGRHALVGPFIPLADFVLEARVKNSVDNSLANIIFRAAGNESDSNNRLFVRLDQRPIEKMNHYGGFNLFEDVNGTEYARGYYDFNPTVNKWYNIKVVLNGSNATGYLDGEQKWKTSSISKTTAGYILLQVEHLKNHDALFDNIFIHKYVSTEPTVIFDKKEAINSTFVLKDELIKNNPEHYIRVISPNGGEDLCLKEDTFIEWESNGLDAIDISLSVENGSSNIGRYPATNNEIGEEGIGRMPWKAGSYFYEKYYQREGYKTYKITITGKDEEGNTFTDSSDGYFSLSNCAEGY
jgi:hypothetical protein